LKKHSDLKVAPVKFYVEFEFTPDEWKKLKDRFDEDELTTVLREAGLDAVGDLLDEGEG